MTQSAEHISLDDSLRHAAESLEKARHADEGVIVEDQGSTYRITFEGETSPVLASASVQDPFLALSGAFESQEPSDVATHKHDYLADAYDERRVP